MTEQVLLPIRILKESDNSVITMDNDDPDAIDCYLEFLYTSSPPINLEYYGQGGVAVPYHESIIRTFQLGNKYDATVLMDIMREKAVADPALKADEDLGETAKAIEMLWHMGDSPNILMIKKELMKKLVRRGRRCFEEDVDEELPERLNDVLKRN